METHCEFTSNLHTRKGILYRIVDQGVAEDPENVALGKKEFSQILFSKALLLRKQNKFADQLTLAQLFITLNNFNQLGK